MVGMLHFALNDRVTLRGHDGRDTHRESMPIGVNGKSFVQRRWVAVFQRKAVSLALDFLRPTIVPILVIRRFPAGTRAER